MGKPIPRSIPENFPQAQPAAEGPLVLYVRELTERLSRSEEVLDLDELDRIARRHARPPASGSAEALEALAVVVRWAPQLFARAEINLSPGRLEQLADRERALTVLNGAVTRFSDIVQDSRMEQGDETVELLTVGWRQAQLLPADQLAGNERLATAMAQLLDYHGRVAAEGAHRVPAEVEAEGGEPKKGKAKKKD